jgi:hypothetical protein
LSVLSVLILVAVLAMGSTALIGCGKKDTVKPTVIETVDEIATRNLGYRIGKRDPALSEKNLDYIDNLPDQETAYLTAVEMGIGALIHSFEDDAGTAALMREDCMSLVKAFGLNPEKNRFDGNESWRCPGGGRMFPERDRSRAVVTGLLPAADEPRVGGQDSKPCKSTNNQGINAKKPPSFSGGFFVR